MHDSSTNETWMIFTLVPDLVLHSSFWKSVYTIAIFMINYGYGTGIYGGSYELAVWKEEYDRFFLDFVAVGRVRGVAVGEGSICIENG